MTTALTCTAAVGLLKDPGKFTPKRKVVHALPYPVSSQTKRLSCLHILHRRPFSYSHTNRGPPQDLGSRILNLPLFVFSYHVFPAHPMCTLSGWRKNRHAPSAYPPVTPFGTVLHDREALVSSTETGEETELEDSDEEVDGGYVIEDTLKMFGWAEICAQVAKFASTPMGLSIARDANLDIGASKLQSEGLLEQTADACALSRPLLFTGIENLQGLVAEAMSGTVCEIKELCSVKDTLIGIQSVHDQLHETNGMDMGSFSAKAESSSSLQVVMADCDLCSDLLFEINNCLDCKRCTVLDTASPGLAAARWNRQENMRALEASLKDTAAWIVQKGGMDSVILTRRRARLCIAVRSSHKSLLPGGVTLDVSKSGTTSYMEPEPALRLNNEESRLAAKEKAEEIAVLRRLTLRLVDKAYSVMDLLGRITVVDLACARASHARWLGCVRPFLYGRKEFCSTSETSIQDERNPLEMSSRECTEGGEYDQLMVDIEGMRHPLLLGAVLPNLPSSQRSGTVQSFTSLQSSPGKHKAGGSWVVSEAPGLPVPVDIKVKSKVRVVTITGPNTGGKTATLKAFGLAAIMAKAGLFLPAVGQPKLPWFDMVLADVGDAQSLKRSLSTYSGHIRRLCSILELCTDQSFILLDEIGGGTDPSEGAAIAISVLKHLSSKVWLTVATTHSAELKTLKDQDSRFENASVEFDVATLKPTYRVLWGVAGQSNALDIAESLGFDVKVVNQARELVGKLQPSQRGVRTAEVLVPLMKQRDELLERSKRAAHVLSKAQELHQELKAATVDLPKREAAWKRLEERKVQSDISIAKVRMDQVVDRFEEATEQEGAESSLPSIREAQSEIAAIVEEFALEQEGPTIQELFPGIMVPEGSLDQTLGAEALAVGEEVLVRKLGKTPVTIIELPQKDTDFLTVQLGTLKMQIKPSEVTKISRSGSRSTPTKTEKMSYTTGNRKKIQSSEGGNPEPNYQVAVQTSKNTLELRGMRVEDAIRELNTTLASKSPQSVLFVIHGIGTGAVKEAVLQTLQKHPFVAKSEEESITNAGCTIVYIK